MRLLLYDIVRPLAAAWVCSFGFALLYRMKGKNVLASAFGGMLTWAVYLFCARGTESLFVCNMLASVFAAVYAEAFARVLKCPSTVYLVPTIIPLVPGGSLYYTLLYLLSDEQELSERMGLDTLSTAGGIAVGIVVVSVVVRVFFGSSVGRPAKSVKKM